MGRGRAQPLHLHDLRRPTPPPSPGCNGDPACNWGYQAGVYAYHYAQGQGVNPFVTWWLDVEARPTGRRTRPRTTRWSRGPSTPCGTPGINNVGIYTSPAHLERIAGDFQPAVPLWVAWYTGNGRQGNCPTSMSYAAQHGDLLPTGAGVRHPVHQPGQRPSLDGDYAC